MHIEVVRAVFCCRGKVLLILENFVASDGLYWLPPGGKIKAGEQAADALYRELEEKLGLNETQRLALGIRFKRYCRLQGPGWQPKEILFVQHFICELKEFFDPVLLDGQVTARWLNAEPAGGKIGDITRSLLDHLRLDGYLRPSSSAPVIRRGPPQADRRMTGVFISPMSGNIFPNHGRCDKN
ncbi:MAG: NUDIX domain-containing protein [Patescibacteria group bacterium]